MSVTPHPELVRVFDAAGLSSSVTYSTGEWAVRHRDGFADVIEIEVNGERAGDLSLDRAKWFAEPVFRVAVGSGAGRKYYRNLVGDAAIKKLRELFDPGETHRRELDALLKEYAVEMASLLQEHGLLVPVEGRKINGKRMQEQARVLNEWLQRSIKFRWPGSASEITAMLADLKWPGRGADSD